MQIRMNVTGVKKLDRKIKGIDNVLEEAWRKFSATTRAIVRAKSPVVSGEFYGSWNMPATYAKNLTLDIRNKQGYASAVVFGSTPGKPPWPSVGKKTMLADGRIHSSMTVDTAPNKFGNKSGVKIPAGTYEQGVFDQWRLQKSYEKHLKEELKIFNAKT